MGPNSPWFKSSWGTRPLELWLLCGLLGGSGYLLLCSNSTHKPVRTTSTCWHYNWIMASVMEPVLVGSYGKAICRNYREPAPEMVMAHGGLRTSFLRNQATESMMDLGVSTSFGVLS